MIFYDSRDYINNDLIKKNKLILKKVTFDLFREVIFIPRYSTDSYNKLWWNNDEITKINYNLHYYKLNKIKEYRMRTLQKLEKIL